MPATTSPVFLHRGMRTGGTALVHALEQIETLNVLYGIMHPMLGWDIEDLVGFHSDAWDSNHPQEYYYWRKAEPLLRGGMHERFRGRFATVYRLGAAADDPQMREYLRWVVDAMLQTPGTPVLGLERHEGLLPWFRATVPDAVHVGLVRDADAVFSSWLEQALCGSWGFFDAARAAVTAEPDYFGATPGAWSGDVRLLRSADLRRLFDLYNSVTDAVRRHEVDLSVTLAELAAGGSPAKQHQFADALGLSAEQRMALAETLAQSRPAPDPAGRLQAMVDAALPQRQALVQSATGPDAEIVQQELRAAKGELARVYASTSWRATRPLRALKDVTRTFR